MPNSKIRLGKFLASKIPFNGFFELNKRRSKRKKRRRRQGTVIRTVMVRLAVMDRTRI